MPYDDAQFAVDPSAYLAANPDIADFYAGSPEQQALYATPEDFAVRHYQNTGQYENRPGVSPLAVQPTSKTGMVTEYGMAPNTDFSVEGSRPNPVIQTASAEPVDPYAVHPTPTGAPPISQPGLLYNAEGNPYYAAYTNDNDLAGRVMVAPGQKIRLVDANSGEMIFEGEGPDGAAAATTLANAVSQDKGRKAAWRIEADNGQGGWTAQAAERYDPKSTGIWGTLLDIAAPILLNVMLPGVGTGLSAILGAGLGRAATAGVANLASGLIQGESFKNAGIGALGAGATAGLVNNILPKIPVANNAVNNVMRPVTNFANNTVGMGGPLEPLLRPIDNLIRSGLGGIDSAIDGVTGVLSNGVDSLKYGLGLGSTMTPVTGATPMGPPLTVTPPASFDPLPGNVAGLTVTAPSLSTLPGFGVTPSLIGGGGTPIDELVVRPRPAEQFGVPIDPLAVDPNPQGFNPVEELVVRPPRPAEQPGVPIDPLSVDPNPQGLNPIEEAVVTPARRPPVVGTLTPTMPVPSQTVIDDPNTDVNEVEVRPRQPDPPTPVDEIVVRPRPADPPVVPLGPPIVATDPGPLTTPTPLPVTPPPVYPPPVIPGQPTPVQPTGTPYVPGNAGTRASLDPIFSKQLPPPTFGVRTPRNVNVDQRYAIERPEQSFFSSVPMAQAANFSVRPPSEIRDQGIGDLNADGLIDELDRILWRRRYGGQGYAEGGFAVKGDGDGRSDSIDAKLSDGEYVIDAETVALLGNGSNDAGARQLDKFRVNVRKHKGRELSRGRFSVKARDPHDYLARERN